jgi:hypothetical protein
MKLPFVLLLDLILQYLDAFQQHNESQLEKITQSFSFCKIFCRRDKFLKMKYAFAGTEEYGFLPEGICLSKKDLTSCSFVKSN